MTLRRISLALALAAGMSASLGAQTAATTSQEPAEHTTVIQLQSSTIPADEQASKEELDALFNAMRLRSQLDGLMKSMSAVMQQQVLQQLKEMEASAPAGSFTAEDQQSVEKFTKKYMDRAMELYPVNEMIDDIGNLYKRHISREDVEAITVFYQSPAAQHLLDAQPAIMQEYMPLVQSRMQERTRILMDEMKQDMQKMKQTPQGSKGKQS